MAVELAARLFAAAGETNVGSETKWGGYRDEEKTIRS